MNKWLIVVDVQNDFVTGPLGSPETQKVVKNIKRKVENIREYQCKAQKKKFGRADNYVIIYTRDTHRVGESTIEASTFPRHCIFETPGWCICDGLYLPESDSASNNTFVYNKDGFACEWTKVLWNFVGSDLLPEYIEIVGLVTDICVISNVLYLRSLLPNTKITVDASCCAGTSPEMHKAALQIMKGCCIDVVNEDAEGFYD